MSDALLTLAATLSALSACVWLALSHETHWQQVHGEGAALPPVGRRRLRVLSSVACLVSLALTLSADHPSMASLVWVMLLSGSAIAVAFTLTWFPRQLRWWLRPARA